MLRKFNESKLWEEETDKSSKESECGKYFAAGELLKSIVFWEMQKFEKARDVTMLKLTYIKCKNLTFNRCAFCEMRTLKICKNANI